MGLDPIMLGTVCCIFSALGYTAVNICLRFLTVNCDQVLIVCIKELVAVVIVGPWLVWGVFSRRVAVPSAKMLTVLVVMGLLTQLGANLPVLWAMSIIGLAITIPVCMGVNLIASALIARAVLGEQVSRKSAAAIGFLVGSIAILGMGANQANVSMAATTGAASGTLWVVAGVVAAGIGGCIYALLAVVIRRSVTGGVSLATVVFITTAMGVVSLGPLSLWNADAGLLSTPPRDLSVMLLAGSLNLVSFLAVVKGLQLTTVAHANVLGASQVAMAVVAGTVLFAEPPNPWLIVGVSLTIVGMILIEGKVEEAPV